jgi:hypothetical protein
MINNITDNWNLRRQNLATLWRSRVVLTMFNERKVLQLVLPEDSLQLPDSNGHEGTETP